MDGSCLKTLLLLLDRIYQEGREEGRGVTKSRTPLRYFVNTLLRKTGKNLFGNNEDWACY